MEIMDEEEYSSMDIEYQIEEIQESIDKLKHTKKGIKGAKAVTSKMFSSAQEQQRATSFYKKKLRTSIATAKELTKEISELDKRVRSDLDNTIRPEFTSPEFSHPLNFLEDLSDYFEKIPVEFHTVENIVDCLRGDAYSWAMIFKERWSNVEDFKKDFLEHYWSQAEQSLIRRDIACGVWDNTHGSMTEHFISLVGQAKLLTRQMPEEDLVDDIMCHFPENILSEWKKRCRMNRTKSTIVIGTRFLQQMDQEMLLESKRPKNIPDDSDEDYDDFDDEPSDVSYNGRNIISTKEQYDDKFRAKK